MARLGRRIARAAGALGLGVPLGMGAIAGTAPAAAPQGGGKPSFVCVEAAPEAERIVCGDPALAALDRRVAARAAAALAAVKGLGAGAPEALAVLRATERGWIAGRDACAQDADKVACVKQEYLRREGALVARYMLEKPASAATFACDGDPANAVKVYVFKTELPSVRLEYGDKVDTGAEVPAASGTRYEASLGRSIWIRDEAATFVWPEGREMTCRVVK